MILLLTLTLKASGIFKTEESVALLEMVVEQRATSDIERLMSSTVDWGPISCALKRQAHSVRSHYDYAIWTPLARMLSGGDELAVEGWKSELCEAILADEAATERRAIRWREMHGRFPDVAPQAMLHFIGNITKRHERAVTFRERIQHFLENPPNPKLVTNRLDVGMMWGLYSKLREMYA